MARGSLPEMGSKDGIGRPPGFDWVSFLFKIDGRIGRRDLWLRFILPYLAINFVLASIDVAAGGFEPGATIGTLSGIFFALSVWPSIAVNVKRLHDRDSSGWMLLITLIPVLGHLWLLIYVGLMPGTPGPNRFGPPPG